MSSAPDELTLLSDGASAALLEFFEEQCTRHGSEETPSFPEDWNLSQVRKRFVV